VRSEEHDMLVPTVETLEEYRAIYHREDLWRPVLNEICGRHAFLEGPCVRGGDGTHIVYLVGASHVVKLFVPLYGHDFVAETLVGRHVEGRLGVATPAVVADGEIDGWRYLIMTCVPGRPLEEIWSEMSGDDRRRIAAEVGQMIAHVRALPVRGLEPLAADWGGFLSAQAGSAAARHRVSGLTWDPSQEIPSYLESLVSLRSEGFRPVLLLSDITREHVLVSRERESWEMVSYVDFGDAMIGHPDYELVAPGLDIARGDRSLVRALLLAAGYAGANLDENLQRRLMAYTLMHRYVTLDYVLTAVPEARGSAGVEDLAGLVWPVC
jgi:hygromycin-B 7''-O-kinase